MDGRRQPVFYLELIERLICFQVTSSHSHFLSLMQIYFLLHNTASKQEERRATAAMDALFQAQNSFAKWTFGSACYGQSLDRK